MDWKPFPHLDETCANPPFYTFHSVHTFGDYYGNSFAATRSVEHECK